MKENFNDAKTHLQNMLQIANQNPLGFPRTIGKNGKMTATNMYDWTSGFFPGNLWYLYEYSQNSTIKQAAINWTEKLEPLQFFTQHHDLGFMVYCSFGNAYRLTGNKKYKDVIIEAARALSTRFNATTGSLKSWNVFQSWHADQKKYDYPVIIDNLMNLELLFAASLLSGDASFRSIAITHALTQMKNNIREDHSSYHVVCYDSITGKVLTRQTAQGYADNSTWSRGQAWGIYGFTMCYRFTKDQRFLKTAKGMADYFLDNKNLPADKIPYWDFNANETGYTPGTRSNARKLSTKPRDASAAAVVASALFELSSYVTKEKADQYQNAAIKILHSLATPAYRSAINTNGDFILMHSTGSVAHGVEIDQPLIYADYYFLEALKRYSQLLQNRAIVNPVE